MSKPANGTYRFTWSVPNPWGPPGTQSKDGVVDDTGLTISGVPFQVWSDDVNGGKFCTEDGTIATRCQGNGHFVAYYDHGDPVVHDSYAGTCEKIA